MSPDEALTLAKRMLHQLARLSPGGAAYRERAAVLIDVLSIAGYEYDAENLALAVAGRYPSDQAYTNEPGDPVRPAYQLEVLTKAVDSVRRRILGPPRQQCGLSARIIAAWLKSLVGEADPDHVRSIVRSIKTACGRSGSRRGGWLADGLYGILDTLRLGVGLRLEDLPLTPHREDRFDYINMRNNDVPTIAVIYPSSLQSSARFVIATYNELAAWSARQ